MVKLNEIELPVILEKKLLFGPGKWNDWNIDKDEVLKSIDNTEWNKKSRSLFYSHEDDKAEKWVGSIANEFLKNGKVYGDLKICDADLAFKLTEGEAPFAVSAGIKWPAEHRDPIDFSYRNFSLVVNPGIHNEEIYINFSDKGKNTFNEAKLIYSNTDFSETDFALITAMEKKRKELGLSVSQFYAAPRDPPSESALPIFDASHVKNALARFNQTHFLTSSEKKKARSKIISAAKKFKIEISANFNIITEIEEDEPKVKEVKETVEETPTEKVTEELNLISNERRLKNMVNEEEKTETIEEEKPEVEESKVEEVKEEVEDESEETTNADFSELKTKLDEAISRIKALEDKQANFEESKPEPEVKEVEESKVEEPKEEVKEEVKEQGKEEETEEDTVADFNKIANKLDRVASALENKAAPMSTAEFSGTKSKKESVTDRLTSFLNK